MRVLAIAAVLAALGAVAGFSGQSGAQPPQAIAERQDAAINAVLSSKGVDGGFRMFPSHVGSRRCVIYAGGLSVTRIAAVCSTRVTLESGGSALVGFVERWPKESFHAEMPMIRRGKGCVELPARPSLKLSFA